MDSIDRFYDRMFPDTLTRQAVSPVEQDGSRASITTLNVELLGECEDWPSHDMVETCNSMRENASNLTKLLEVRYKFIVKIL